MNHKKNNPLFIGTIAAASPVPLLVFTVLWSWFWGIGIGIGLLHYDTISGWLLIWSLLPLIISPIWCIVGIIYGCIKHKQKRALLGIFLSIIGLIENFLLLYGLMYIGSRF